MSTDQRASERVGELIQDLKQLLAPHCQMTRKFIVPQEKRFRENWDKFISVMEGANSSATPDVQQVVMEVVTAEPVPAPLSAIAVRVPEKVTTATRVRVW